MKLLPSEIALIFLFGGAAIGYCEFLRPGTVAPGVAGMVLLMLGIARIRDLPWSPVGPLLLAAGMAVLLIWRGTWWGIPLLLLGARYLIEPEAMRVRTEGARYVRLTSAPALVNPDTGSPYVHDAISSGADIDGVVARYVE